MCPQSTPSKKGWPFISSTPLFPILFSESIQNLEKRHRDIIICKLYQKIFYLHYFAYLFFFTEANSVYCGKYGRYNSSIITLLRDNDCKQFENISFQSFIIISKIVGWYSSYYFRIFCHLKLWEKFPKSLKIFL